MGGSGPPHLAERVCAPDEQGGVRPPRAAIRRRRQNGVITAKMKVIRGHHDFWEQQNWMGD